MPDPTEPEKKVALVTKSRNGVVSIIRDLTPGQAQKLAAELYWIKPMPEGVTYRVLDHDDSDIVETHIV